MMTPRDSPCILGLAVLGLLTPLVIGQETSSTASALPLRMLPLGDSITYGYYSSTGNGYRQGLLDLLAASDYTNTTYVGTLASGTMAQNHHDGYPGARIAMIEQAGLKTLTGETKPGNPNVVLLHAGTNDAYQNHTADAMISDLRHLVTHIFALKPKACVLLSEIIMNRINATETIIRQYNSMIPAFVANFVQAGMHVQLVTQDNVDLNTDDNPQHLQDLTHPGDIGFAKMARNWFYGLNSAVAKGWVVD